MFYRLYIDEVGHSHLGESLSQENRYLNLTGVALNLSYVQEIVHPDIEVIKKSLFKSHVDDPVILHRKDILYKRGAFRVLHSLEIRQKFDNILLKLLKKWEYCVFSVTIDMIEHYNRYKIWHFEPYHYSLSILLERYVLWLESLNAKGDVMAESRGGKEDMKLKKSFTRLYENGTDYVSSSRFKSVLSSRQLKIKNKLNNIGGLQIADLLAYPCYKYIISERDKIPMKSDFSRKIISILTKDKFYKDKYGKIIGWGIKWLP